MSALWMHASMFGLACWARGGVLAPASGALGGRALLPVDVVGGDGDLEAAFGSFVEGGAVEGVIVVGAVGVEEFHVARSDDFEAVVEVGSRSKRFGAEAGAGIVDFERCNGLGGVIADRGGDVG